MDQSDDANFPFEYDIDEAVRQYQKLYPCEGNVGALDTNQAAEADCCQGGFTSMQNLSAIAHMSASALGDQCTNSRPTTEDALCHIPNDFSMTEVDLPETYNTAQNSNARTHSNLTPNAEFRFQSGAVLLDDKSEVPKKPTPRVTQNGLKCDWPNCKYRGTFGRKAELQRHMKKHTAEVQYQCPIIHCERSFYRQDKLSLHLKRVHKDDEDAKCPKPGCEALVVTWLELRLHVSRCHYWGDGDVIRAIKYVAIDARSCPIESCGSPMVSASKMQAHLQAHTVREREQNSYAISKAGYHEISAEPVCPVCAQVLSTLQDLANHVEDFHISTGSDHLRKFRTSLRRVQRNYSRSNTVTYWVFEWELFEFCWKPAPIFRRLQTPPSSCCGNASESAKHDHHIQFLQEAENLRPHRSAILRLWPEFRFHPIFDDITAKRREP